MEIIFLFNPAYKYAIKKSNMKNLKNFVQLIGNLGQDVELREFDNGMKKANFTLY